jgi:cytoskeletal protein RodZ
VTELGNRLKEARLAKGLSLEDLQSITKIQKRYLIGIEEGNYSSMPGNFYVRAFVKQYQQLIMRIYLNNCLELKHVRRWQKDPRKYLILSLKS